MEKSLQEYLEKSLLKGYLSKHTLAHIYKRLVGFICTEPLETFEISINEEELDLKRIGCVLRNPKRLPIGSPCSGEERDTWHSSREWAARVRFDVLRYGGPWWPLRNELKTLIDYETPSEKKGDDSHQNAFSLEFYFIFINDIRFQHKRSHGTIRRDSEELLGTRW